MDYIKNVELALSLGFEEIYDRKAYKGKYYIKDGIIWIHDIEALKTSLNISKDEELNYLNYDVESYYKYVSYTNKMVDKELELIKFLVKSNDSALSGKNDLLANKENLEDALSLMKEGFDEEIIADFAHQMSKK